MSVIAACVCALTSPGIRTWLGQLDALVAGEALVGLARREEPSIAPSRTATAWCSRTAPAGSTGTTQRALRRKLPVILARP